MPISRISIMAVIALAISASNIASAQIASGSSFFDQIISVWHLGVSADFSGGAAIPVDTRNALHERLGVYEGTGNVKFQGTRNGNALNFGLGYTHTYYDFDGEVSPFSDANTLRFNTFCSLKIGENGWSGFIIASGALGAESSGDLFDGGRITAGTGVGYVFSKDIRAGLGMCAYSRLDNTWLPLPTGYLDWTINKNLKFRMFGGAAVLWDIYGDNSLVFNATFEYKTSYYRLSGDIYGNKLSFGDFYYQFTVGATYNFTKDMYISALVGANINREIIFRINGNSAQEIWVDTAPVCYLHLGVRF